MSNADETILDADKVYEGKLRGASDLSPESDKVLGTYPMIRLPRIKVGLVDGKASMYVDPAF